LYVLFNGHLPDIEDAEQDTMISLLQALPRFRGKSSFKTFYYRICRNRSVDILRRRRLEKRLLHSVRSRALSAEMASFEEGPEARLLRQESRAEIRRLLWSLSRAERILIVLKDVEGISLRDLARIMKIPEGTAKSRLHRARRKLAKRYEAISAAGDIDHTSGQARKWPFEPASESPKEGESA
jgi:RNA polymerase sigma-70 factor (ECF subfamily)